MRDAPNSPSSSFVFVADRSFKQRSSPLFGKGAFALSGASGLLAACSNSTTTAGSTVNSAGQKVGPGGLPLLDACPNWFAGRILDRVPMGDHVGHVLDPFAGEDPAPELGWYPFSRAKQIDPGHPA